MEKLEGYKTIAFFTLVFVVEVANLLGLGDFKLTADQQQAIALFVPVIGWVLRYFTKTPIFSGNAPLG